jgi:hypothetical protein
MPQFDSNGFELIDAAPGAPSFDENGFELIDSGPSLRPPVRTPPLSPYSFTIPSPAQPDFARGSQVVPSLSPSAEDEAVAGQNVAGATYAGTRGAGATGIGNILKGLAYLPPPSDPFGETPPIFPVEPQPSRDAEEALRKARRTSKQTLEEIRRDPLYQFGETITEGAKEAFPVSPEMRKGWRGFAVGAGEATGGLFPLIASGPLGPATIGVQSLGAHLGNDFEQLKAEGMGEEKAAEITLDRALRSGVTAGLIFQFLPGPLRKLGDKYLIDKFGETAVKRFAAGRAAGAAEGAVLMPAAHVAENIISERPATEGISESAAAGALMLGVMPRGRTKGEQAFRVNEPRDIARERAIADTAARDVAQPIHVDWKQSRPVAYQFGTGAETRNIQTPIRATASAPPIEIARRPEAPQPPKPPRAVIPETPPEERITAIEEIRRAKATTIRQIQNLFPRAELSREEARKFRDAAWPTQKGVIDASNVPSAEIVPEPEVRPQVGQEAPLRQPGQAAAPQEAQAQVVPVEPTPPSPVKPSETPPAAGPKPPAFVPQELPPPPVAPVAPLENASLEAVAANVKDMPNYTAFAEILAKQFGAGSKEQFQWLGQTPFFKNAEGGLKFTLDPMGDVARAVKPSEVKPPTAPAAQAPSPGPVETAAQKLAAKIRSAKFSNLPPGTKGALIPPPIWDGALEIMARSVEAGGKIADATAEALRHIRENIKEAWDESETQRKLYELMGETPPESAPEPRRSNIQPMKAEIEWHQDTPHKPGTMGELFSSVVNLFGESKFKKNPDKTKVAFRDQVLTAMRMWKKAGLPDLREMDPAAITPEDIIRMQNASKGDWGYDSWQRAVRQIERAQSRAISRGLVAPGRNAVKLARETLDDGQLWDRNSSNWRVEDVVKPWWDFPGGPGANGNVAPALIAKLNEWRTGGGFLRYGANGSIRKRDVADALEFLIHTGVRPGEAPTIFWSDVSWNRTADAPNGYIRIYGADRGKQKGAAGNFRELPLTTELRSFLERLKSQREELVADGDNSGYTARWNPNLASTPIWGPYTTSDWLSRSMKEIWRSLGMPADRDISPNDVRAYFIDRMVAKGVPQDALAKWLGHSLKTQLEAYRKIEAGSRLREAAQQVIEPETPEAFKAEPSTRTILGGDSGTFSDYPVSKITYHPEAIPNFKAGASEETGVVRGQELGGKYQRTPLNPIVAWEPIDGKKYGLKPGELIVATGRHRLDLARRTKEETVPTQILKESEGWTRERMMLLDAMSNIRDEQGTIEDYADFFRNSKALTEAEATEAGLLRRAKGRSGWDLGRYSSEDLYALYKAEKVTEAQALAIVRNAGEDAAAQRVGAKQALAGKSPQFIADLLKASAGEAKARGATMDLFGADDSAMKVMEARANRAGELRREVERRLKAISGAAKNPELARAEGVDVSDPASVTARVTQLRDELARWENWPSHPDLVARVKESESPARPPLELSKPESVEEQKARLAQEDAARRDKSAKDKLAEESAKPMEGTSGDLGQGDLLNAPEDLFAPPEPKPTIVDQAISAIEEAQKKLRGSGENLGMALPKAVLDVALETVRLSLKAGKSVAEAIEAGLAAIRGRIGKEPFNETRVRAQLTAIMAAKERLESPEFSEARQIEGQVMGIRRAGERYGQESITAIQKQLRQWEQGPESEGQTRKPGPFNFGPDVPVTPENTQRAFQTISNLIDLPTAESELLRIRDTAPEQMAPGILLSDLFRYAVRAMHGRQGDPSLVYHIAENYDRINTATGPMGPRGIGRALRALREGADDPTLVNLLQLFDAMEEAAATKLYGKAKLEKIAEIAREVQDGVTEQIGKPETTAAVENKIRASGLTPELAWMRQFTDQLQQRYTEWLKPDSIMRVSLLSQIKAMIKEWEKRNIGEGGAEKFTQELGGQLHLKAVESIEAENIRREAKNEKIEAYNEEHPDKPKELIELIDITTELLETLQREMNDLSREVWIRKLDAQGDVNKRAGQAYVEKALDQWGKEQTDWLKPGKVKTEAQKEFESFMDHSPFAEEQRAEEVAKLARALAHSGARERTAFDFADAAFTRKLRFDENARLKAQAEAAKRIYNESEGVARSMLAKMRTMKIPMTDENSVREAIKRAMRLVPTRDEIADYGKVGASQRVDVISNEQYSQRFVDELTKAGVLPEVAVQLAREVQLDRLFRWNTANAQAMKNASKSRSVSGLIEELLAAPVLMQKSPQWRAEVSRRWFESNGLSKEDATAAAKIFKEEFDAQLDEAAKQLAERIGRRENFSGERFSDFVSAIRAGMLDPSKPWAMKFAEAKGIRIPTPDEMQKLSELDTKLEEARINGDERDMAEIGSEMMAIYAKMHLPPEWLKVIAANVVGTQLTGLRTLVVQGSPLVFTALDRVYQTIAAPLHIKEIWTPVFHAMDGMLSEIKLAVSKDAYTFVRNELTSGSNTLRRLWETGVDDLKRGNEMRTSSGLKNKVKGAAIQANALKNMLFGSQQYFLRILNAMDQASGIMVRESQLVQYGSVPMKEAGFSTQEIAAWVEATHKLKQAAYLQAIVNGDSPTRAKVHADSFAAEMIRVHLKERLIEKGVDPSAAITAANKAWKSAENDAYSVIGRLGEGVKETEEGGLLSRGIGGLGLHTLLKWSSAMRRGEASDRILAVTLLGYVNVPIRTARFFAWNSAYGLMRMGIHHGRRLYYEKRGIDYYASQHNWWKQSLSSEYQAKYRMKNALAATAVQAALTAAGIAYFGKSSSSVDTQKDNQIFVTGEGPKSKELKDAWLKSGFRPNSVVAFVDGKPATMPLTRLGEPMAHLFWILAARDDYNWRKKEKEATGKEFKESWSSTLGYTLGNYAGLLGQRGPLATAARFAKATGSEGGSKMLLATSASGVAASMTMPYLGMQRSIREIAMGKVDTSSVSAAMAANFPILGAFQNRAINRFGDPLGNRLWSAVVGDAAGTVSFQVEDNPQNRKLYQTLVNKGIVPPTLRRGVLEEKYGEMSNSDFGTFAQRSGDMLKKATLANLSVIEKQKPEDAKKTVAKLASTADNVAAKGLSLERVTPARTASGGMSVPAAAGSSGGLLGGNAGILAGGGGLLGAGGRGTSYRRPRTRRLSVGRRLRAPRSRRLSASLRRPRTLRGSSRRLTAGLRRPGMRLRRLAFT